MAPRLSNISSRTSKPSNRLLAFVNELPKDWNQTQAAIRAGYSPRSANVIGAQLMNRADVQALVAAKRAEHEKRSAITVDWIAAEYAKIARADPRAVFDAEGHLKPVHEWDDDNAAALNGMDIETSFDREGGRSTTTRKVKRIDKTKALDALGRHLGFFPSQAAAQVTLDWGGLLEAVAKKVLAPADAMKVIENDSVSDPAPDGSAKP